MILANSDQNKGTWIILKNILQQRKCEVLAHTREMSTIGPCNAQFQKNTIHMAIHHSPCSTLIILFTLLLAFTIYIRDCLISVLKACIILEWVM